MCIRDSPYLAPAAYHHRTGAHHIFHSHDDSRNHAQYRCARASPARTFLPADKRGPVIHSFSGRAGRTSRQERWPRLVACVLKNVGRERQHLEKEVPGVDFETMVETGYRPAYCGRDPVPGVGVLPAAKTGLFGLTV